MKTFFLTSPTVSLSHIMHVNLYTHAWFNSLYSLWLILLVSKPLLHDLATVGVCWFAHWNMTWCAWVQTRVSGGYQCHFGLSLRGKRDIPFHQNKHISPVKAKKKTFLLLCGSLGQCTHWQSGTRIWQRQEMWTVHRKSALESIHFFKLNCNSFRRCFL